MKLRKIPGWNLFEYALLRGAADILNLFPMSWATPLAALLGRLFYWTSSKRRKTGMRNLGFAYGDSLSTAEKRKIIQGSLQNLLVSMMEFFRIPKMIATAEGRFAFKGMGHLDAALAKGNGVILVISHLGSWEYLAFLPYLRKYPCSVVVREIKNPYADKWSRRMRRKTGLNPIDRVHSVRQIFSELKKNHVVAILIDQWAGPQGVWMNFFNQPTSTTAIPARLAHRTGAALVPMYCMRTSPGHYEISAYPEIPVAEGEDWERETTKKLNDQLEQQILKYPDQWIWSHRRWKDISRYSGSPAAQ